MTTESCQMDLTKRCWNVNRVQVRYWTPHFLALPQDPSFLILNTANDLLHHFIDKTESIKQSNSIHL